ncbi:unnamed protein product [Ambrosiozyma monospora]|uniref:Unnamed protein product n=1 Tax=Ambrosiozyma monospora TaxID=43982 RepID=A0ACB5SW07_AMBMO|nr:unnamed protein product [Ambrosiozyma monospora]
MSQGSTSNDELITGRKKCKISQTEPQPIGDAESGIKTYEHQLEILKKDALFKKLDIKTNPGWYWKAIHLILGTVDISLTSYYNHGSGIIYPYTTTSPISSRLLNSLNGLTQKHEHKLLKTNETIDQKFSITPVPCDEIPSFDYFSDNVKSFSSGFMKILQADDMDQMDKHEIWLMLCSLKSKEYEAVDVNGNELALHVAI